MIRPYPSVESPPDAPPYSPFPKAACAAANLAIGTLYGEHET